MGWRNEWSRHYDQIQWTATTILTGIVGGLVAYSYTVNVGKLNRVVVYVGFALTWLSVYYAASFRELRQLLHANMENKNEEEFLSRLPHKLKQWPAFLVAFGVLAAAWVNLCWKHEWRVDAVVCGVITIVAFVVLSKRGAPRRDIDKQSEIPAQPPVRGDSVTRAGGAASGAPQP